MKGYKPYSKAKFECELTRIRVENELNAWTDVTDELSENSDVKINEYVYAIRTNIGGMRLLIYSSIDKNTERTRDVGSDAVRVVLMWRTRNGELFSKIAKLYRVETLFENLEEVIVWNSFIEKNELYEFDWCVQED